MQAGSLNVYMFMGSGILTYARWLCTCLPSAVLAVSSGESCRRLAML